MGKEVRIWLPDSRRGERSMVCAALTLGPGVSSRPAGRSACIRGRSQGWVGTTWEHISCQVAQRTQPRDPRQSLVSSGTGPAPASLPPPGVVCAVSPLGGLATPWARFPKQVLQAWAWGPEKPGGHAGQRSGRCSQRHSPLCLTSQWRHQVMFSHVLWQHQDLM